MSQRSLDRRGITVQYTVVPRSFFIAIFPDRSLAPSKEFKQGRPLKQTGLASFLYILYTRDMKIITTTVARKEIGHIVNRVKYHGDVFAIGRRNSSDAPLIEFPQEYNRDVNDVTNVNAHSKSFDFLHTEPELYTASDLKKKYV